MFQRFFLTIILLCCVYGGAETIEQPYVAVFGTAEIKVAPNEMQWQLNVRNEAKELSPTAARHAEIVSKVVSFLKGLNIDKDKLQTSRMQFGENWEYRSSSNVKVGYYASTEITFTITDFGLYEKLWFGLAGIEGVSIQGTQYAHSDRIRLQNESRQKALLAARDKAAALAGTLGAQLGDVLKIEESAPDTGPMPLARMTSNVMYGKGEGASAQILEPGQITISTQVQAVFKLIK